MWLVHIRDDNVNVAVVLHQSGTAKPADTKARTNSVRYLCDASIAPGRCSKLSSELLSLKVCGHLNVGCPVEIYLRLAVLWSCL